MNLATCKWTSGCESFSQKATHSFSCEKPSKFRMETIGLTPTPVVEVNANNKMLKWLCNKPCLSTFTPRMDRLTKIVLPEE
jgi:hypothetical protein